MLWFFLVPKTPDVNFHLIIKKIAMNLGGKSHEMKSSYTTIFFFPNLVKLVFQKISHSLFQASQAYILLFKGEDQQIHARMTDMYINHSGMYIHYSM